MKKALYIVFAVVLCCLLVVAAVADTEVPTTCQACGTDQNWTVMPTSWKNLTAGHYHYYLSSDVTPAQLVTPDNVELTICLDLNGHSINTDGRAVIAKTGTTLNIMDSSSAGTGYIAGSTGSNNTAGGSFAIKSQAYLNLYSGTLKFIKDNVGLGLGRGGVVGLENGSTMQVLGGRVEGTELVMYSGSMTKNGYGAAIYMDYNSTLTVSGGEITSGTVPEGGDAPCVYIARSSAKVILTGNGNVEEICSGVNNNNLVVKDTYTGRARFRFDSAVSAADGMVIGTAAGADISGANLICTNDTGYTIDKTDDNLTLKTFVPSAQMHMCDHCKDIVRWTTLTSGKTLIQTAGHHHIYLSEDYTGTQLVMKNAAQVCLDLYGKSIKATERALHVSDNCQLNLMDTVGGGEVAGATATNNPTGGTVAVKKNSIFNLYSGTLKFLPDDTGYGVGYGGVVLLTDAGGVMNMFGGLIEGTDIVKSSYNLGKNGYGGAIAMASTARLNVFGGEITSGTVPEDGEGPCIYMNSTSAKVLVSGKGSIEEIFFPSNNKQLTVSGTYTGSVNVRFADSVGIQENTVVGVCEDADISGATFACTNGDGYSLINRDGALTVSKYPVGTVAATGGVGYTTLQAAVDTSKGELVELLCASAENVTVSEDVYLQLNGNNITGTVTVSDGAVLYGMDSKTDDFTVSDGTYGTIAKVVGAYAGAPVNAGFAEDSYVAVAKDGGISFHCVRLQIYAMSLRPEQAGIYYKSHFLADEMAAEQINSYGVALSVVEVPNADNLETKCKYSTFSGFESGPNGNIGNASSTLLKGILKEKNSDLINMRNLNTQVYGRAYARTAAGEYIFGKSVSRSLAQQLKGVDSLVGTLSEGQVAGIVQMYQKYATVLEKLSLTNILSAVNAQEKGTLKILVIGNSHGLDSINLLYEVFHAEQPEQKLVLGALYVSGCSMEMHADYMVNNKPMYAYYKNDGTNTDRVWSITKETTCLDTLRDEQWDVIVLQQQNHHTGMENKYVAKNWATVFEYVCNNQDQEPKILWNMLWTNPDDYDLYINDDAPLAHPDVASYRKTYETNWPGADGKYDHAVLYEKLNELTQKYLVGQTEFLGENQFDDILPCAVAIEYAMDVLERPDPEIFRDWTHLNDYGRLIVSYVWYAKIMDIAQISEVNVDSVPTALHHSKSAYPADLTYTDEMKADLIEAVNWALANPYTLPEAQ